MWQVNTYTKKSEEDTQILDEYNREISNTRVVVSGIIRQSRKSEFEKEPARKTESCCYNI
jgi:hypothetical protein